MCRSIFVFSNMSLTRGGGGGGRGEGEGGGGEGGELKGDQDLSY